MKIRTRLTLWYAAILFVSILTIAAFSYHELIPEHKTSSEGDEESEGFGEALKIILWCGVPAALIGLGGGWFLMRKALAPVSALTQAAGKIHEGNLREQLPRSRNGDELDQLTEVFNNMTARLDDSFRRIREFTLHASHELKTPLTVMRGEIETALREETLADLPRERLLSQLDEIQRLAKIVDGLSLLTKADAGEIALQLEPIQLDELVRDSFDDAQILAQNRVQVRLDTCEKIQITGDRHRLRQLLLNLTDNAIKYNQPGGSVAMELRASEKFAELKISNTGPGISPEQLQRVFDRFYRGDESHTAIDGCGLGLSIAQWVVQAHGGSIELTSAQGKVTTALVRLPRQKTSRLE